MGMVLNCGIIEHSLRLLSTDRNKLLEAPLLLILVLKTVLLEQFIIAIDFFTYSMHDLFWG